MKLPLRQFWFLQRQVDRLRAEDDLRRLQIMSCVTNADTYETALKNLQGEMGQIYVWQEPLLEEYVIEPGEVDPAFDKAGLDELRNLAF